MPNTKKLAKNDHDRAHCTLCHNQPAEVKTNCNHMLCNACVIMFVPLGAFVEQPKKKDKKHKKK